MLLVLFVLLGFFYLLIRYCKKRALKVSLLISLSLISVYYIILNIDMYLVNNMKKPMFVIAVEDRCSGSCDSYLGLGYRVDIKYLAAERIEKIEMIMFNKVIAAAIANNVKTTEGLTIVPTMQDIISGNAAWAPTFQLIWNDLMDEIVGGDVVFGFDSTFNQMVVNLNKQEFTSNMISDSYFYKKYGLKTLDLKAEIEKGIKDKFNQTSDILDLFDWSETELDDPNNIDMDRLFFYAMLYRKFEYLEKFTKLDNDVFGSYPNVEYFGIDKSTQELRNQFGVLFYNSPDEFAILINTKSDDEVIFYKSPKGDNFKDIYENMISEANKYDGDKILNPDDLFKAPNIKFNELREYNELCGKTFLTIKGLGQIVKAIQTIQFELTEEGGKIKSEAAMDVKNYTTSVPNPNYRSFKVDNTFVLFLKEKEKDIPYFAAKIEDITKFQ